jgi:hypothetical protein
MACEAPAGSAAGELEALVQMASLSLSASTERADMWRDKGISFRPYQDESDMVRPRNRFFVFSMSLFARALNTCHAGCAGRHG